MKLYSIKDKSDNKVYEFLLRKEDCPKVHLKSNLDWIDADLRTLKENKIPTGRYEGNDLDENTYILFDGEPIVIWNDSAARYYPEDLSWSRDISRLVESVEKLKDLESSRRMVYIVTTEEMDDLGNRFEDFQGVYVSLKEAEERKRELAHTLANGKVVHYAEIQTKELNFEVK